jgi:Fe-Mn family superoxide dismutase
MRETRRRKHGSGSQEQVDEASQESFPASDAPSFAGGAPRRPGGGATTYRVRKELKPKALDGFSEEQLAQHWKLYEGYVENVNKLNSALAELSARRSFGPEFAELKRRLGFEYDGMILHEHYFGILKPRQAAPAADSEFASALKPSFKGFDAWKEEFAAMGAMRGVGWVILYLDPQSGALSNHWIGLHEVGHPAGFAPILVMDVWEHAYMVDRGASGRKDYVAAFLKNVDWGKAALHVRQAKAAAGVER